MPADIEQIRALDTEVHLFLFVSMPVNPWEALSRAAKADAKYTCLTQGADNQRGMIEADAAWRINSAPALVPVPGGRYRTSTPPGMQQVRATVQSPTTPPLEYSFEVEQKDWEPELSEEDEIRPSQILQNKIALFEASGGGRPKNAWKLVTGFRLREGAEADRLALERAKPKSGAFVLVSLRTRKRS